MPLSGAATFSYHLDHDAANRVTKVTLNGASAGSSASYSYHENGRLARVVLGGSPLDRDADGVPDLLDNCIDAANADQRDGDNDGIGDACDAITVYEDAEDGATAGWDVYDDEPPGAVITNVYDEALGSRVIRFAGALETNGYRLRLADLSDWNNVHQQVLQWRFRYAERFTVYVLVDTGLGPRFLTYHNWNAERRSDTTDITYLNIGIAPASRDDAWTRIARDLAADIRWFEPDNELLSVRGFWTRGSGRVDDIQLLASADGSWLVEDADDDGTPNGDDALPLDPGEQSDNDLDGIGDNADPDDDNDTVADAHDNCRFVPNPRQIDIDQDAIGDVCDPHFDAEGVDPGVLAEGLAAHYPLDGDAVDVVGGYHGTAHGVLPGIGAGGQPASGVAFDGVDDYIGVDAFGPDLGSAFTISAWIKADQDRSRFQVLVSKGPNDSGHLELYVCDDFCSGLFGNVAGSAGELRFFSPDIGDIGSDRIVDDGAWHHVAVTYDGALMRFFVDGGLTHETAATGALPAETTPLNIGRQSDPDNLALGASMPFAGAMDDLRIYARALSDFELRALHLSAGALADRDEDGVADVYDNCPQTRNAAQANYDRDAYGDACDADDDNDGMPDAFERRYGFQVRDETDAEIDRDADGLTNHEEYLAGTNPRRRDSDADGVPDGTDPEPTDPLQPNPYPPVLPAAGGWRAVLPDL